MYLTITITTDNAAFEEDKAAEVCRILRVARDKFRSGYVETVLFDHNGNNVGGALLTGDGTKAEALIDSLCLLVTNHTPIRNRYLIKTADSSVLLTLS